MNKIWILTLLVAPSHINAQLKSFELSNPHAIELTGRNLELLKSCDWNIKRIDTKTRENVIDNKGFGSLEYFGNGTFQYRGSKGTWELIDSKFLNHKLDNYKAEGRLNFGGIYSATELTDSTLVLTKLLTSTNDMSRTIYLKKYDRVPQVAFEPYYYKGPMDERAIDSLGSMSVEDLFISNFNFRNDSVFIQTPDSLYRIKRKKK